MKLGDYLSSINYTKKPIMDTEDELVEKKYLPFIVNKCLSYFPDTIMQVNEMNFHSHIDKKMQFDFLSKTIRKSKRYSPWMKEELPDNIEIIKEYFGYNNRKAKEALEILSEEDIENMKISLSKGGIS